MLVCFDDSNFNLSQFLLFFRQLLTISAVNDAPIIAGDLSATVNESGRYVLSSSDLGATDIEVDPI